MIDLAPLLISAVILGLLGGGHCIGMCGGLMGALTMAIPSTQKSRRWQILILYNLGRVLSYSIAGLIIGTLGFAASQGPGTQILRISAALLLIAMGIYLAGWGSFLTRIEALGKGLWRHIQPIANTLVPVKTRPQALLLGMLWGWLPCGLVYSTLLWAASQGNALHSGALMLAFGLGTLPVLLLTGLAATRLTRFLQKPGIRVVGGLWVIAFGLWTLPGPHQHWLMGHP